MKAVWKYELGFVDGEQAITMPSEAEILCVQMQRLTPCLWVTVDVTNDDVSLRTRKFICVGTGHPTVPDDAIYIDSVLIAGDSLVFHFFEVGAKARCSRCGLYFLPDPNHPGYADVHECLG